MACCAKKTGKGSKPSAASLAAAKRATRIANKVAAQHVKNGTHPKPSKTKRNVSPKKVNAKHGTPCKAC